jgi:hypothetical protein
LLETSSHIKLISPIRSGNCEDVDNKYVLFLAREGRQHYIRNLTDCIARAHEQVALTIATLALLPYHLVLAACLLLSLLLFCLWLWDEMGDGALASANSLDASKGIVELLYIHLMAQGHLSLLPNQ